MRHEFTTLWLSLYRFSRKFARDQACRASRQCLVLRFSTVIDKKAAHHTVHLAYVRQQMGHALTGCRQWIPAEHLAGSATARRTDPPAGLRNQSRGVVAISVQRAVGHGWSFPAARRITR